MEINELAEKKTNIFFMIIQEDDKYYVTTVDAQGNRVDPSQIDTSLLNDLQNEILEEIKINKNDSFSITWGNEPSRELYIEDYPDILKQLEKVDNFVDKSFNKMLFIHDNNNISLSINESENDPSNLNCDLIFDNIYKDPIFVSDEIVIIENKIFYISIEKDDFHSFDELICKISKIELERFLTMTLKYFKGISIDYMDYEIIDGPDNKPVPQIMIEKIAPDKSLYLKTDVFVSTMDYNFIKGNSIVNIAVVNDMEKKIIISKVDLSSIYDLIDEISKTLIKRQKDLKVRSGFFIDEDNLIIMQEKLAKDFIMKDLLLFASKYKIEGTDRLRKYNIRPVKPKIVGKFGGSIDYLDGNNLELDIDGEKFSILDVVSAYKNGTSYVSLSDGTNALINKKYIEKLERLFKDDKKNTKLSFFDYPLIEDMIDSKILDQQMKSGKDFFKGINNLNDLNIPVPHMNAALRSYQEYGYKWLYYLLSNDLSGCLADDMGLGKTLQAITLLTKVHENHDKKSLVIMPKSLIFNWDNEIKRFSPSLQVGIYYGNTRSLDIIQKDEIILTTYGTIRNDIEKLKDIHFDIIILDESQNIKNVNAQTTKAIMLLNSKNRVALSGTPIENNLSELYSLFRFLNPPMFGTFEDFNNYYAVPIQKNNDKDAIDELKRKIYPFILRRVKKEVLKDLPDKIEKTMFIEMNPSQKRLYEERRLFYYKQVRTQIKENGLGKTQFFILQALNELRQITSCPENKSIGTVSSKKEVLIHNVLEAVENGHKVLVFTNYVSSISSISEELTKNNIKHLTMSGNTKDRQSLVDIFQHDKKCKVFVMTLKTGGVGLNLTAADTIFIYDPWWNKTVENQAIDRAYRLGQDRTVFSYKLILKDSIEEKILKLQEKKSELLDSIISEDNASVKILTEKDIDFILGD